MTLNLVDSSGWLEYFAGSARAPFFRAAIQDSQNLIVSVVSVYEVFKKVLRDNGEDNALQAASAMQNGRVIDLEITIALEAARHRLPLAASIIYATAQRFGATLWTQDVDFEGLPGVEYLAK